MIHHALLQAVEGGNAESAGMGPTFVELTGHMSASHAAFLAQWLRLVDLEEGDVSAKRSEIWAMPGAHPVMPLLLLLMPSRYWGRDCGCSCCPRVDKGRW